MGETREQKPLVLCVGFPVAGPCPRMQTGYRVPSPSGSTQRPCGIFLVLINHRGVARYLVPPVVVIYAVTALMVSLVPL